MGSDSEHQAVLEVLAGCRAADPSANLEARVRAAVEEARTPVGFAAIYAAYGDDAYGLALRVLGDEALARETIEVAFFELQRGLGARKGQGLTWPESLAFVCDAVRDAHRLLCKARRAPTDRRGALAQLDVDAQLLLLCRSELGLSPLELARALGAKGAKAKFDLASAAAALANVLGAPDHEGGRQLLALIVRDALGLDLLGQEAELRDHLAACTVCAVQSERLKEELSVPLIKLSDPEAIAEAIASRSARDREHKAAVLEVATRVSLNCTYCHSAMLRGETAFCSTCLAPHHEDCFTEHGRCSAPGCGETVVVKPAGGAAPQAQPGGAPTRRRRGWLTPAALFLLGGGLVAAAAGQTVWQHGPDEVLAIDQAVEATLLKAEQERATALERAEASRAQLVTLRSEKEREIEELRVRLNDMDGPDFAMGRRRYDEERRRLGQQLAQPDLVVLESGKTISGQVVRADDEEVVVRTQGGMIAVRRDEVTRIVGGDRIPELLAQIERLEADKRALEAERQKVVERWRSFEKEAEARGVQLPEALVKQMRADMGVLDDDMRRRIEERFARIERLASERKVEELIGEFTLLRDLMNEFGESGSQQVKEAMEKWRARLGSYGEVQLSVQLQIYISEGNQYLKSLAKAAKAMQHAVALDKFSKLVELRRQMLAEERDVFHRNAEALWKRGRELALEGGALAGEIASARTNDEGVRVLRLEGGEVDCGVSPALQKKLGGEGARLLEPGARVLLFFEGGARDGRLVAVFADNGS